ncbi:hypothetical protein Bbelb_381800 [Branchiostoma belcheri]|nr:hypothetical protein Bbelb_381800 [Branchiostoma belcheri]
MSSRNICGYKLSTEHLSHLLQVVVGTRPTHLLITGDFNYPEIDWKQTTSRANDAHPSHQFLRCVHENLLYQHVFKPTRYRPGEVPNVLDLVLTNEDGMVENIEYLPGIGQSDHIRLQFEIKLYTERKDNSKPRLNLYRGDYASIAADLAGIDWDTRLENKSFDEAYSDFKNVLQASIDSHIPRTSKKSSKRNLFATLEVKKLSKKKRASWDRYTISGDEVDYARYSATRNDLRSLTRRLRYDFESNLVRDLKQNPKSFWRYVNSRLKTKTTIGDLKKADGTMTSSNKEKADTLNQYFCSVFTEEDTDNMPCMEAMYRGSPLEDIPITPEIVLKKLKKLKKGKSPGPDELHPKILAEFAETVANPLALILRKSLDEGRLADEWRTAHITAIHKKGPKTEPGNYRPISLTSVIVKLFESVLRDALVEHMMLNDLFCDQQHGFVPGRSCTTQLITTMDQWTRAVEEGEPLDAIYLDLRKAFDSVPHARLMYKLSQYGISGKLHAWIQAFLTDRRQRVCIDGDMSDWVKVTSGIPQGSVLGPFLFVVFINDMPSAISSTCYLFADDAKVFRRVNSPDEVATLQADINNLAVWSKDWQLSFNIEKCKCMHIGYGNPCQEYEMQGRTLEDTSEERDLGVIVDKKLKFHAHCNAVAGKAFRTLGLIRKSFQRLDETTVPLLYKTMVRPIIEYGNAIWGPYLKGDQELLDRVQHKATRLIPGFDEISYEDRLRRLKLPTLGYRRKRGDMIQIFKFVKGFDRVDPNSLFNFNVDGRTRGHSYKIVKPQAKKSTRANFFSVRTVNSWNSLPAEVVAAETVNSFKSKIDNFWKGKEYNTDFT